MTQESGYIRDTVAAGARIAHAILREWISAADLAECKTFSDTHDYCDSNIALYGAFAAIHFDECDAGKESHAEWINAVAAALDSLIRQA